MIALSGRSGCSVWLWFKTGDNYYDLTRITIRDDTNTSLGDTLGAAPAPPLPELKKTFVLQPGPYQAARAQRNKHNMHKR
jgi:hypothetical protein